MNFNSNNIPILDYFSLNIAVTRVFMSLNRFSTKLNNRNVLEYKTIGLAVRKRNGTIGNE